MIVLPSSTNLAAAMMEEGLVPHDCFDVTLEHPADGAVALRYSVYVTPEDLPKLARAFAKWAEMEQTTRV